MLLVLAWFRSGHAGAVSAARTELVGAGYTEASVAISETTTLLVLEWTGCGHMGVVVCKVLDGTQEPPVPGYVARMLEKAAPGDVDAGPATPDEGEEAK